MNGRSEILIEGYTEAELLALPREYIQALILAGQPVVFRAGSAAILGEFRVEAAKAFWYNPGARRKIPSIASAGRDPVDHRHGPLRPPEPEAPPRPTVLPAVGEAYYLLELIDS
jgi:hypothetical protein